MARHGPLEARIVSCCDAYNAMTTTRSYRTAMPVSAALAELHRNAGTQFDRQVVDALVRIAGRPAEGPFAPAAEIGAERRRPGPLTRRASYSEPEPTRIAGASMLYLTEGLYGLRVRLPPNRV